MIPTGLQVFVALEPIDMRWSFDRLAGAALERIGYDARSGALFIYFDKRRDAVKVLFFDGSGMCVCVFYKKLLAGRFELPKAKARRRSARNRERRDLRGDLQGDSERTKEAAQARSLSALTMSEELAERDPALAQLAAAAVSGRASAGPELRRKPREPAFAGRPGVIIETTLSLREAGFS